MGSTPKPLCILLTDPTMKTWEAFDTMAKQGHTILGLDEWASLVSLAQHSTQEYPTHPPQPDLVMGPIAHYLITGMEKQVSMAVKAARERINWTTRVKAKKKSTPKPRKKKEPVDGQTSMPN